MSISDRAAKYGPYRAITCEWSIGVENGNLKMCGDPTVSCSAYCTEHLAMAYRPPSKKKKKKQKHRTDSVSVI